MAPSPCKVCGGNLRRSRRTIAERFFSSGAYRCQQCGTRRRTTALVRIQHAHFAKCPKCSTPEISELRKVDGIDKMRSGPLNLLHRLFGGRLYHCWFCRLQFYDARPILETPLDPDEEEAVSSPIDKQRGDWKLTG